MIALHFRWDKDAPPPDDRFSAVMAWPHGDPRGLMAHGGVFAGVSLRSQPLALPVRLPDGRILLFVGYLDDRTVLARALGAAAPGIGRADDASLYAAALIRYGEDVDSRVCGQYCAIVCDPAARTVRLARSPLRAPPLHYWRNREEIVVASAPRLLFATGAVPRRLDEHKIADTLVLNYLEEERSWFDGVRRVPIGTAILCDREAERRYANYDPMCLGETRRGSTQEYVEEARALMADAVRSSLDGFERPAISLSGGMDSQAVAAFSVRNLAAGSRLTGYTAVPDDASAIPERAHFFDDELPHARALASMYDRLDVEPISSDGWIEHRLGDVFELAGIVPRNPANLHWIHAIWDRARVTGNDVMMTGSGGNLTFSADGNWAFGEWALSGRWRRLRRELVLAKADDQSVLRALYARVVGPLLPSPLWQAAQALAGRRHADPLTTWCPINPAWAKERNVGERAAAMGHDMLFRSQPRKAGYRCHIGSGEAGDIDQAFLQIHGIAERDPTLYRPLVEFCHSIPTEQYIGGGETRLLARRMLAGLVPEQVRNERRRGFQGGDWVSRLAMRRGALADELGALSRDPAMAGRMDLGALKTALDHWDGAYPTDPALASRLMLALPRALATARFIRTVEAGPAN